MKPLAHCIVLGVLSAATASARAQQPIEPCPRAAEVKQSHMLGLWRAEFEGLPRGATLLLEKHAEDEERLAGAANRDGTRSLLAGDVGKGEFNFEESDDGRRISATWSGEVIDSSCGREVRGTWTDERADPPKSYPFVLRKQGGW